MDFPRILGYQTQWKSVRWDPSFSMRTDRHDEADNCFLQLVRTCLKITHTYLYQQN